MRLNITLNEYNCYNIFITIISEFNINYIRNFKYISYKSAKVNY